VLVVDGNVVHDRAHVALDVVIIIDSGRQQFDVGQLVLVRIVVLVFVPAVVETLFGIGSRRARIAPARIEVFFLFIRETQAVVVVGCCNFREIVVELTLWRVAAFAFALDLTAGFLRAGRCAACVALRVGTRRRVDGRFFSLGVVPRTDGALDDQTAGRQKRANERTAHGALL
jgi:hypothetical protein